MSSDANNGSSQPPHAGDVAASGPPHGITLHDHARISALIAEGDRPVAKVLEESRITEDMWNDSTRFWMMRMADDVQKNGAEARVPMVYSDAFSKAQDAIKPVVRMTPEEWAALTVEIQQTGGVARPLAVRNLSQADYLRLARHMAKELAGDPKKNQQFFAAYEALQPKAE